MLKIENLRKSYDDFTLNCSMEVRSGCVTGLIGRNGAGKSTTIRTLLGLLKPTSGKGEVLGQEITAGNRALLSWVGYLPSEAILYRGMQVRELLRFSAGLRQRDFVHRRPVPGGTVRRGGGHRPQGG